MTFSIYKNIVFFGLLIALAYPVQAQFSEHHAIYTTTELSIGNYLGIDLNLNYIYEERYSFKIGYAGQLRKPRTQPTDFSSGLSGVFLFGLLNPYDKMDTYQLGVGKIYMLNPAKTIRLNLSVGLGYTIIREPENWQSAASDGVGSNYTWDLDKVKTLSLIINPKIEFPLLNVVGFTVSPVLQVNKQRVYVGIGLGDMFGLLRK